jgi:hypothetical protein
MDYLRRAMRYLEEWGLQKALSYRRTYVLSGRQ